MPEKIDLGYAIGLEPKAAMDYFRAKGLQGSWDWQDVWQEAHAKSFVVAKCVRMDVLQDIKAELEKALAQGIPFQQFKKELEPRLKARGWWGYKFVSSQDGTLERVLEGSPRRLKVIYRTNMQTAYMAGRYKAFMKNTDDRPYWQYVAVLDSRTRPKHRALNGKVFRYDDPFWDSFYPPNDWGCRCRVRALSDKNLKDRKLSSESSAGLISEQDVLVSQKTGEVRSVPVYHDPDTGKMIATGAGWGYNPGKAAWFPDLDKYDYDVAKTWIAGGLTSPDFKAFYEGKVGGNYPIAVLPAKDMAALSTKSQTVYLSSKSLKEHRPKHSELSLADYQKLPAIISKGEAYQQGDFKIIYLLEKGILYRASVKTTKDRKKNFLVSLFKTNNKKADKQVRSKLRRIR